MQSDWLSRQPIWLVLALVLAGFNALILNDVNTYLPGAEAFFVGSLGAALLAHPFWLRLPAFFFLFASLAGTYWIGKRFWGKETSLLALFVLVGSLLLIHAAKWATGDLALLLLLVLASLGMLGQLKQDRLGWRLLTWVSGLLALLIQPVWALFSLLGIALVWRFRHPQGKRMDGLYLWVLGPLFAALFWWWQGGLLSSPILYWSWISATGGWAMASQLLGMLPWLGFLAAGLVELWRNQLKGEELSILWGGLFLGALLGGTLMLQWVCALLVAKQLQRFLAPGYPYGNLIKTFTLLILIGWVLGGILGLIYGYYEWGATGFRMGMSMILAYWMPGLVAAIGLFGRNQQLTVLGSVFGVLLLSLAFWGQAGPQIEGLRNYPQRLLEELDGEKEVILHELDPRAQQLLVLYAPESFIFQDVMALDKPCMPIISGNPNILARDTMCPAFEPQLAWIESGKLDTLWVSKSPKKRNTTGSSVQ